MIANPNQTFVFAFGDEDLPGFVPQQIHERGDGSCSCAAGSTSRWIPAV